jgi:hypothetical protein
LERKQEVEEVRGEHKQEAFGSLISHFWKVKVPLLPVLFTGVLKFAGGGGGYIYPPPLPPCVHYVVIGRESYGKTKTMKLPVKTLSAPVCQLFCSLQMEYGLTGVTTPIVLVPLALVQV